MKIDRLPIICSLLPIGTAHLCYWLAVEAGHVELCVPYWDSCTSISKTGRQLPEAIVFKMLMIPAFVCCAGYWHLMGKWLVGLDGQYRRRARIMGAIGVLAAVFLILYGAALGYRHDLYQLLRRIGVTLGFAFTLIAQLMETGMLLELIKSEGRISPAWAITTKYTLVVVMLVVGALSIFLDYTLANYRDTIEDAIEWNFTLLMFLFYLPTHWLWRNWELKLNRIDK